ASAMQKALLRADSRPRHPEIDAALAELAKRLALPDDFNSPRHFDPTAAAPLPGGSSALVKPPGEAP
ncbi:MAG TPA: hypothetical protein VGY53_12155, partial [Isosphaeraceae bacterium]|nr:hypothetical protein [Isosphaeraceae bacterium]